MTWIEDLVDERRTHSSTVIVVETADSRRPQELMDFLRNNSIFNGEQNLLVYDTVDGLMKPSKTIDNNGQRINVWEKEDVGSKMPSLIGGGGLVTIEQVLPKINERIKMLWGKTKGKKANPTLVVMKGIQKENQMLDTYLINWATHDVILQAKSTVVLIVQSRHILSQDVLNVVKVISPPNSTPDERRAQIEVFVDKFSLDKDKIEPTVTATGGLNLNQLDATIVKSFQKTKDINIDFVSKIKGEFISEKGTMQVHEQSHGFEMIGGYKAVKELLNKYVINPYKLKELAYKLGLETPRGVLFFGNPGTGKTVFAHALAKELGMPLVSLTNVKSKYVGESERNMAEALKIAQEMSPCIVFIDEIDAISTREDSGDPTQKPLFGMLLSELSRKDRKWILVGTTNMPDRLDKAMIRSGRMDYKIPINLPDTEARKEILKVHTEIVRKVPLADDVDLARIAHQTQDWSGAELEEMVKNAQNEALDDGKGKVDMNHFEIVLNNKIINKEKRDEEKAYYDGRAKEFVSDKRFYEVTTKTITEGVKSRAELIE